MIDWRRHILSLIVLGVFSFLAAGSLPESRSSTSDNTSSQAESPKPDPEVNVITERPGRPRQLTSRERSRINYAEVLQLVYKREGRFISVSATGEKLDTMEVRSVLIGEGTYTLDAARRETIDCTECMRMMKQLGFKTLVITGTNFHESWKIRP